MNAPLNALAVCTMILCWGGTRKYNSDSLDNNLGLILNKVILSLLSKSFLIRHKSQGNTHSRLGAKNKAPTPGPQPSVQSNNIYEQISGQKFSPKGFISFTFHESTSRFIYEEPTQQISTAFHRPTLVGSFV